MESVKVKVLFTGSIQAAVGKGEMEMEVSSDIKAAAGDIRKEILKYAPDLLYTMLVNGSHYTYALKAGTELKNGDVLNIIPVTLGG